MKISNFLYSIFGITFACQTIAATPPQYTPINPIIQMVDGGIGGQGKPMQCTAYLYGTGAQVDDYNNNYPLYLIQQGAGNYTTGNPIYKDFIDKSWFNFDEHDYILMMDKPGISYDPSIHDAKVDRTLYDYYTTDNLITCAHNAIVWANGLLKNNARPIIFYGHSEGTLVLSSLTNNIVKASINSDLYPFQNQLKGLFLSGVAMSTSLEYQMCARVYDDFNANYKDKSCSKVYDVFMEDHNDKSCSVKYDTFMHSYNNKYCSKDYSDYLENWNNGVFTQTEDDWFYNSTNPSLHNKGYYFFDYLLQNNNFNVETLLNSIFNTDKGKTLPIEIFHGLHDESCNPVLVSNYTMKIAAFPYDKSLNIESRFYNSPHVLTPSALLEMGQAMKNIINPPPSN